jgi:hypothetical protein
MARGRGNLGQSDTVLSSWETGRDVRERRARVREGTATRIADELIMKGRALGREERKKREEEEAWW